MRGRVENVTPNLSAAYTRTIEMNISRLKAYVEKWITWVQKNKSTGNKSYIPQRHQQKIVLTQDGAGNYVINRILFDEYTRMTET